MKTQGIKEYVESIAKANKDFLDAVNNKAKEKEKIDLTEISQVDPDNFWNNCEKFYENVGETLKPEKIKKFCECDCVNIQVLQHQTEENKIYDTKTKITFDEFSESLGYEYMIYDSSIFGDLILVGIDGIEKKFKYDVGQKKIIEIYSIIITELKNNEK